MSIKVMYLGGWLKEHGYVILTWYSNFLHSKGNVTLENWKSNVFKVFSCSFFFLQRRPSKFWDSVWQSSHYLNFTCCLASAKSSQLLSLPSAPVTGTGHSRPAPTRGRLSLWHPWKQSQRLCWRSWRYKSQDDKELRLFFKSTYTK